MSERDFVSISIQMLCFRLSNTAEVILVQRLCRIGEQLSWRKECVDYIGT